MAADAARGTPRQALLFAAALLCAAASPINVSPRLDLPASTSIGVAPRDHWADDAVYVPKPAPATAIRAVLEVVVPTTTTTTAARVVCVAGATGCRAAAASTPTTTAAPINIVDDDEPLVVVGTADKATKDDAVVGADGALGEDGAKTKVFFVDEDPIEDTIKDRKKKKDKMTPDVPIIISYDGWKGKTLDDIPINPNRRNYNSNFDMEHDYSGLTAPANYGIRPQPPYKTLRTNDVPVTIWDVPLGTETTLLVHRLLKSTPIVNALYPTPSPPPYGNPPYNYGGSNWRPQGSSGQYPGGYRGVVNRRTYPPSQTPGFYGGSPPRLYPRSPRPATRGTWCPPSSPVWPSPRPVYPTPRPHYPPPRPNYPSPQPTYPQTTTTVKPVLAVGDKLDFDDSEEDKNKDDGIKILAEEDVKIVGQVTLDDWK